MNCIAISNNELALLSFVYYYVILSFNLIINIRRWKRMKSLVLVLSTCFMFLLFPYVWVYELSDSSSFSSPHRQCKKQAFTPPPHLLMSSLPAPPPPPALHRQWRKQPWIQDVPPCCLLLFPPSSLLICPLHSHSSCYQFLLILLTSHISYPLTCPLHFSLQLLLLTPHSCVFSLLTPHSSSLLLLLLLLLLLFLLLLLLLLIIIIIIIIINLPPPTQPNNSLYIHTN